MRAKFYVQSVSPRVDDVEEIIAYPVTDGSEENKSFSRWTPGGALTLQISNPNLLGFLQPGQEFYLDFTPIPFPAEQMRPTE